jgi:Ca2+/Na+ antiporter
MDWNVIGAVFFSVIVVLGIVWLVFKDTFKRWFTLKK